MFFFLLLFFFNSAERIKLISLMLQVWPFSPGDPPSCWPLAQILLLHSVISGLSCVFILSMVLLAALAGEPLLGLAPISCSSDCKSSSVPSSLVISYFQPVYLPLKDKR